MSDPLAFENLGFAYPGTSVFDAFDLRVAEGEMTALLGPNGSGKTTLLRLATRVVTAARGRVLIEGDEISTLARGEVARRVAVVPQAEGDLFSYSVEEAVLMGRAPWTSGFGFESERDREIARDCLVRVQAEHLADRDVTALSGGERQRVLIARALAQEGRLLILDEPTAHLDLKHQVGMLRLLRELRDTSGRTVLVISHDVNLCSRFADRMVLLAEGRVVADGAPRDVLRPDLLARAYGTPVAVRGVEGSDVPHVFPE